MKAIMMSIRPQHTCNILNLIKWWEIRKKFPKDYVGWVYIYCTKDSKKGLVHHIECACNDYGWDEDFVEFEEIPINEVWTGCELNGKVVARFWCDKVEEIQHTDKGDYFTNHCVAPEELQRLSCLTNQNIYEYAFLGNKTCKAFAIHITKLEIFDKPKEISEFGRYYLCEYALTPFMHKEFVPLTRAPQSWQFIEI